MYICYCTELNNLLLPKSDSSTVKHCYDNITRHRHIRLNYGIYSVQIMGYTMGYIWQKLWDINDKN